MIGQFVKESVIFEVDDKTVTGEKIFKFAGSVRKEETIDPKH